MPKTIENKYLYVYLHPSLLAPIPKCHGEGSHELTPKIAHGLYRMDPQKTNKKQMFANKKHILQNVPYIFPPNSPDQPPFKGGRYVKGFHGWPPKALKVRKFERLKA